MKTFKQYLQEWSGKKIIVIIDFPNFVNGSMDSFLKNIDNTLGKSIEIYHSGTESKVEFHTDSELDIQKIKNYLKRNKIVYKILERH